MALKPNIGPAADAANTPAGLVDYIVRFLHPTMSARTQVYRAADEASALEFALAYVQSDLMEDWRIQDIMTVDEAIARRGGRRG